MTVEFTDTEISAIRALVMEQVWEFIKTDKLDRKLARTRSVSLVSDAFKCTPEEIESALGRNMANTRNLARKKPEKQESVFVDDPDGFYDDLENDTPRDRVFYLRDQLRDMEIGKARACLYDDRKQADDDRKHIPAAVRYLHWTHNKNNPGYYTEIIPVGNKFKLRIKKLR